MVDNNVKLDLNTVQKTTQQPDVAPAPLNKEVLISRFVNADLSKASTWADDDTQALMQEIQVLNKDVYSNIEGKEAKKQHLTSAAIGALTNLGYDFSFGKDGVVTIDRPGRKPEYVKAEGLNDFLINDPMAMISPAVRELAKLTTDKPIKAPTPQSLQAMVIDIANGENGEDFDIFVAVLDKQFSNIQSKTDQEGLQRMEFTLNGASISLTKASQTTLAAKDVLTVKVYEGDNLVKDPISIGNTGGIRDVIVAEGSRLIISNFESGLSLKGIK